MIKSLVCQFQCTEMQQVQGVVDSALSNIGTILPTIESIYTRHCLKKAALIKGATNWGMLSFHYNHQVRGKPKVAQHQVQEQLLSFKHLVLEPTYTTLILLNNGALWIISCSTIIQLHFAHVFFFFAQFF